MRINFLVNHINGGWEPTDKRLGGTEESVVKWAELLSSAGHEVWVYRNGREQYPVFLNEVMYREREDYHGGVGVCVNVKSSEVKPKEPTLYLTNETDATSLDLSLYDAVVWPSQWAVDNIPVNNRTIVIPHGYDSDKIFPKQKKSKQCLYASSPDRGLSDLEIIWPSVVEQHPDAHLFISYGGSIDAPNTTSGEFSEAEMNELYNTSEFWLHPANGGELFGISGIKAQAAAAIPVYYPTMALSETVREGVPCTDARDMFLKLCSLLGDEEQKNDIRNNLYQLELCDWYQSAELLESAILKLWTSQ